MSSWILGTKLTSFLHLKSKLLTHPMCKFMHLHSLLGKIHLLDIIKFPIWLYNVPRILRIHGMDWKNIERKLKWSCFEENNARIKLLHIPGAILQSKSKLDKGNCSAHTILGDVSVARNYFTATIFCHCFTTFLLFRVRSLLQSGIGNINNGV